MSPRISLFALAALCLSAVRADTPFDKDALEAILKKEHSQKVSNIYDSENKIQCVCITNNPGKNSRIVHVLLDRDVIAPARACLHASQVHMEYREADSVRGRRRRVQQGRALITRPQFRSCTPPACCSSCVWACGAAPQLSHSRRLDPGVPEMRATFYRERGLSRCRCPGKASNVSAVLIFRVLGAGRAATCHGTGRGPRRFAHDRTRAAETADRESARS